MLSLNPTITKIHVKLIGILIVKEWTNQVPGVYTSDPREKYSLYIKVEYYKTNSSFSVIGQITNVFWDFWEFKN